MPVPNTPTPTRHHRQGPLPSDQARQPVITTELMIWRESFDSHWLPVDQSGPLLRLMRALAVLTSTGTAVAVVHEFGRLPEQGSRLLAAIGL